MTHPTPDTFEAALAEAWRKSGGESGTRQHNFSDGAKWARSWFEGEVERLNAEREEMRISRVRALGGVESTLSRRFETQRDAWRAMAQLLGEAIEQSMDAGSNEGVRILEKALTALAEMEKGE